MNATFDEINTEGLPPWLREIVNRAWTTSGFGYKKLALEQAIGLLLEVDLASIEDKDCPICYDAYELPKLQQGNVLPEVQNQRYSKEEFAEVVRSNHKIISQINSGMNCSTGTVEPLGHSLQFNDPSLFLPTDEGGEFHQRVPMRNLSNLQSVSLDDSFPGYKDDDEQKQQEKQEKQKKMQEEGHIAVKMPNCNHIFGKLCIIEWLKNNVSCPLCREEVEASNTAPTRSNRRQRRLNDIRSNLFHNFNDEEGMTTHLVLHSTDVFCPFARPFNPAIAPLTESYMTANWASSGNLPNVGVPDPTIVVPRRFPFPSMTSRPRTPMRRNLTRRLSGPTIAIHNATTLDAPATASVATEETLDLDPGSTRVHFSPHTTTIGDLEESSNSEDSEDRDTDEEAPLLPSPTLNHNPLFEETLESPSVIELLRATLSALSANGTLSASPITQATSDSAVVDSPSGVSSTAGAPVATIASVTGGTASPGRSGGAGPFRRVQNSSRLHPYVRTSSPSNPSIE